MTSRAPARWAGWLLLGALATPAVAQSPVEEARDALAASRGAPARARGVHHALLARAFDRAGMRDSAATHYLAAADLLPPVADWLALRAADVTPDSLARARLYRRVSLPAAAARIPWTEAGARERMGDPRGAADRFEQLGAPVAAARARLASRPGAAVLAALRRRLLDGLAPGQPAADTRATIALLDRHFAPLSPAEELRVARRAAVAGDRERALRGFTAAEREPGFSDADRLAWGAALAQLGRHAEAIPLLARITDPAVAGAATYQRARSVLSRSGAAAALPILREVAERWPADTASASVALYLVGDLLADQGDWAGARAAFRELARRYPATSYGARAMLEDGTLAYALGNRPAAHEAFARLAAEHQGREEGSAGAYWAGRVEAERGDTASAHRRWRDLQTRVPHSYYAMMAARRLGEAAWAPAGPPATAAPDPALLAAMERTVLLRDLGMDTELGFEVDHLLTAADSAPEQLATLARALGDHGHAARGLAAAQRALSRGAVRSPALYRALFPVPDRELFVQVARRRDLDPWFVAGLIRQESAFDPRARSVADARGLMQLLPSVGRQLAGRLGWRDWDPGRLYDPEVSLTLGTMHLAEMVRRYPDPIRVLAAYNAGGTRVQRWESRPGVQADPELFLEMIPYLETRNYVRRVLRNAEFYRAMYGGEQGTGNREQGTGL